MNFTIEQLLTMAVALAGVVGTFAVMSWRVDDVDTRLKEMNGEPLKLALLESDVRRLKCEVVNVKRLLKNQAEDAC